MGRVIRMPPHCDALDGPVVTAARQALNAEDVAMVLPYVPATATAEVEDAFARTVKARTQGPEARDVADRWFFETVVRLHRAGEGAAFTGLKPAGLDVGPVIPVAERVIETGDVEPLVDLLTGIVRAEAEHRFAHLKELERGASDSVEAARDHVSAMLGLQVWSHKLALAAHAAAHGDGDGDHHG
jgi:hypothetical protein